MFFCKKAGQLISHSFDRKLSLFEKMNLEGHLFMCAGCRQVSHKYRLLRTILIRYNEIVELNGTFDTVVLSVVAMERMKLKINEEFLKNNSE